MENNRKKKIQKILIIAVAALAIVVAASIIMYFAWEQAPEVQITPEITETEPETPAPVETLEPIEQGAAFENARKDGVYTVLVAGMDQISGNTDTIMLAKLDTVNHTLNVMNIPRDTLINRPWDIRKINSVYWGSEKATGEGAMSLKWTMRGLIGFDVDCYAVIDLDLLMKAVDMIGGVWFDVPFHIEYEDWSQDLYMYLDPGYQLLSGEEVMWLCRYRSGYTDADIGRIGTQQALMKAIAEQFIERGSIPNASKLLKLMSEDLRTDLTRANMAYFLRQILMCKSEDINFYTAPNTPMMIQDHSYAVLKLWEFVDMVNEYINPYAQPVSPYSLDVVYMEGNAFFCTGTIQDPDYYIMPTPTPSPDPSRPQSPAQTPAPAPSEPIPDQPETPPENNPVPEQGEAPPPPEEPAPEEHPNFAAPEE